MKNIYSLKSFLLIIYYGLKYLIMNFYIILGLALIIFSGMMIISTFYPDNPLRFLMMPTGIFSLYFGNHLLLKHKKWKQKQKTNY
jgi:hypothetical protein